MQEAAAMHESAADEISQEMADCPRIIELVESHSHSDRIAVSCPRSKSLTYRALHENVNRLSRIIAELCPFKPNSTALVLVVVDRNASSVVTSLAIVSAKAAFVPIDPDQPEARKCLIAGESGAAVAVVSSEAAGITLQGQVQHVILVDEEGCVVNVTSRPPGRQEGPRDDFVVPAGIAYVMFTSGSTGIPKGVMVGMDGLLVVLGSFQRLLQFTSTDTILAVTTFSFDISVLELLLPVISGGSVLIAPREDCRSGVALVKLLRGDDVSLGKVTCLQATPATWKMILNAGWQGDESVRVLCGGETFPEILQPLSQHCRSVLNLYGPTEATIWCAAYEVPKSIMPEEKAVPIGSRLDIEGLEMAVFDSQGRAVAEGEEGELWISGPTLALGYLGTRNREQTMDKFICHNSEPSDTQAERRWYKTGDLVRIDGGRLYFVRRIGDEQVKLAGYRVEVGEIEAIIRGTIFSESSIPALRQLRVYDTAVVPMPLISPGIAGSEELGIQALCAFVVLRAPCVEGKDEALSIVTAVGSKNVKRALNLQVSYSLPPYMLPKKWMLLFDTTLPLNANGKLDRLALSRMAMAWSSGVSEAYSLTGSSTLSQSTLDDGAVSIEILFAIVKSAVHAVVGDVFDDDEAVQTTEHVTLGEDGILKVIEDDRFLRIPDSLELAAAGVSSLGVVLFSNYISSLVSGLEVPASAIDVHGSTVLSFVEYLHGRGIKRSQIHPMFLDFITSKPKNENAADDSMFDSFLSTALLEETDTAATNREGTAHDTEDAPLRSGGAAEEETKKRRIQQKRPQKDRVGRSAPALDLDAGLQACRDGDINTIRALVQSESWSIHTVDRFGSPGLHWACSGGHLHVGKLLIELGADPNQRDKKSGRSALHWAARQGQLEVCKWLVDEHNLSVNDATKDDTSAFHLAVWGGFHDNIGNWLLSRGANLHHLNSWNCNAAHFAALAGELDSLRWLHEKGLNLANVNTQGHNALHKAAYGGWKDVCSWLQDGPSCIDRTSELRDVRGQSPVDLANKAGFPDLAHWLVRHRSTPTSASAMSHE